MISEMMTHNMEMKEDVNENQYEKDFYFICGS